MYYSILYAVLAALALGILVFIHELGHFLMARREGMRVEAFSIGFGKPFLLWKKDGVQWQLCWIPFGGYVKIAGMEKKGSLEPHEIADGFYGRGPWSRIKVALAGPLINIFLAFIIFSIIWVAGGREKPFSECTHVIGWIDPQSDFYKSGVRPGDEITTYGNQSFTGFQQVASAAILDQGSYLITGEKINYLLHKESPFSYTLDFGNSLTGLDKIAAARHLFAPASYLIYDKRLGGLENSPMQDSGMKDQDRVLWVDGELIFSKMQLSSVINQPKVLLTVVRGDQIFLTRIPRMQIGDLRLNSIERVELEDLEYSLKINAPLTSLYFIPYILNENCQVESTIPYIDDMAMEQASYVSSGEDLDIPLIPGDRIVSVEGTYVTTLQSFFSSIQKRKVQMIVVRGGSYPPIPSQEADAEFMKGISFDDLNQLIASIGTASRLSNLGNLYLLNSIEPKPRYEFPLTYSLKDRLTNAIITQKKQKEGVDVSKEKTIALRKLEESQKQVMLGLPLEDRMVNYNPSPFRLMWSSVVETWKMIYAMVTGYASPKYFSGPVGIVQVIQHGWSDGVKEVLFLIAAISFNLGIVNLLPIPVLDGGHICFSLYELITKKNIKAKTMERLVIPFFVLFIAFFIYLTYQDLIRLLGRFF